MGRNKRLKRLKAFFAKEGKTMMGLSDDSQVERVAGSGYVYVPCHEGRVKVFEANGLSFYGGGKHHDLSIYDVDKTWLLIDLANNFPCPVFNEGFQLNALKASMEVNRLAIAWPDGGVAPFGKEHWKALVEDLRAFQASGGRNVLVCCLGGHGRTGTALAILWNLFTGEPQPIRELRRVYCKKVVERDKQVRYINEITGLSLTDAGTSEYTPPPASEVVKGQGVLVPLGHYTSTGAYVTNSAVDDVGPDKKGGGGKGTWKDATCEVCGGPAVSEVCLGCNRGQRRCTCPV